jgi:uncharacterized cupredoxin-like copper-binding protein
MQPNVIQFFFALSFFAVIGVAMASGDHPGGHEPDNYAEIGTPGSNAAVDRTVSIEMNDEMRFVPDNITVKQGETIRFLLKNVGKIEHEFVLGTEKDLQAHYEMMQKYPEMEHQDPSMVRVDPDKVGEVVWHFTRAGKIDFACLMPGHFEAGMKGAVSVLTPVVTGDRKAIDDSRSGHQH